MNVTKAMANLSAHGMILPMYFSCVYTCVGSSHEGLSDVEVYSALVQVAVSPAIPMLQANAVSLTNNTPLHSTTARGTEKYIFSSKVHFLKQRMSPRLHHKSPRITINTLLWCILRGQYLSSVLFFVADHLFSAKSKMNRHIR